MGRTSASSTPARNFSASRSTSRSAAGIDSRSASGSGTAETIDGVFAVVIDQGRVLLPVGAAAALRHLLGPDHHVVDAVAPGEVERRRIALKDAAVVVAFLHVVGEPVGPQPSRVADELAPAGKRRDGAVVLVG